MRHVATSLAVLFSVTLAAHPAERVFDPGRDPAKDLKAALNQAGAEHKNVLLDVGGNWCSWCMLLDRTLQQDAELHGLLEKDYVVLHVNFSKENENKGFLAKYPQAKGYPALYVPSPQGRLLKAETDTSELEGDHKISGGYNRDALRTFLEKNGPKPLYHPVA